MSEHTTHHAACACRRTRCRHCGAEIVWAVYRNGVNLAVNADADPLAGNVALFGEGQAVTAVLADSLPVESRTPLHTSHFADCPSPG